MFILKEVAFSVKTCFVQHVEELKIKLEIKDLVFKYFIDVFLKKNAPSPPVRLYHGEFIDDIGLLGV